MEFLAAYGLFFAELITFAIILIAVIVVATSAAGRSDQPSKKGNLKITKLNRHFEKMRDLMRAEVLPKAELKQIAKENKKEQKVLAKSIKTRKKIYVIHFDGDIKASGVSQLREEVNAVLTVAKEQDEVVVCLESAGGLVHAYGLASSQLQRIRDKNIPLTVTVDKVAASGGYMMACVANKIIAAPFAVIGSVGVVAQIPNFHRLLKEKKVDVELLTAGKYKRTLTMLGENTEEGRSKFIEDLETTHQLFQEFVSEHREQVDINEVATGEIWYGKKALSFGLVDRIATSDEYLQDRANCADIFVVSYEYKKSLSKRLGFAVESTLSSAWSAVLKNLQNSRFLS